MAQSSSSEHDEQTPEITPGEGLGEQPAATGDEMAALKADRDSIYDRLLRQTAEFDNYRKRIDRERRDLRETAAADLITDLLPLVDDFERALAVDAGPGGAAYRQGVEIIYNQLLELLRKRGVEPVEALGVPFDPHVHQAVAQEASADHADGEVIEELRRGYRIGARLLRPAMVKVAKA
jgi:molecular chaperone GrpE